MDNQSLIGGSFESLTESFVKRYSHDKVPIPISFRSICPELNKVDRFTHLIHSYPAKLLAHIPYFFFNNSYFSNEGDLILDPFCGTGTVLLEANIAGRNAIGADSNPLARKIASVKTEKMDFDLLSNKLKRILLRAKTYNTIDIPSFKNIEYWFPFETQNQLARIKSSIFEQASDNYRSFFEICFSNCIKKVSYADPRISVPVKLNPNRFEIDSPYYLKVKNRISEINSMNVFDKFESICLDNINRVKKLENISSFVTSKIVSENALRITTSLEDSNLIMDKSVDLILTSPPYAGAQKYIRSSSLNLHWLGLDSNERLCELDKKSIGRENYHVAEISEISTGIIGADQLLHKLFNINPLRAFIVANYLIEMKNALDESIRVLKTGGHIIIIVGNNNVCGHEFNTQEYLSDFISSRGLAVQFKLIDDIKSYGLMTKRNKTANIISREWILVFKKI